MLTGWGVEWHPKGAVHVLSLSDIAERNRLLFAEDKPLEWVLVDIAEDMPEAMRKKVEFKRIKRSVKHDEIDNSMVEDVEAAPGDADA